VPRVLPAEPAVLAELEPFRALATVLRRAVVPAFAVSARQRDNLAHDSSPNGWPRIRSGRPPETGRPTGPNPGRSIHVTRQFP
jgi:hypothetical protein